MIQIKIIVIEILIIVVLKRTRVNSDDKFSLEK